MRFNLFEQINKLRAMAAVLYDKGVAAGHSPEVVSNQIQPIRKTLDGIIEEAGRADLPACVLAIQGLQNANLAISKDIEFLSEKIEDNRRFVEIIKKELQKRLIFENVDHLEEGGFSVTMVDSDLGPVIKVR